MAKMIIEILIKRGMTAVARLTFQGLGASHAYSETATTRLTFQSLGVGPLSNWKIEIFFRLKNA